MNRNPTSLLVVSGPPGAGKTTLCIQVAAQLGAHVGGLVSPARLEGGRKTGILVRDLASGEERLLAEAIPGHSPGWRFDERVLRWGAELIQQASDSEVLVVDELGPLELRQGRGWHTALDVLAARRAGFALVVVRPSLVDDFRARFAGRAIEVIHPETEADVVVGKIRESCV